MTDYNYTNYTAHNLKLLIQERYKNRQDDFATAINASQSAVSLWVNGRRQLSLAWVIHICKVTETDPARFIFHKMNCIII